MVDSVDIFALAHEMFNRLCKKDGQAELEREYDETLDRASSSGVSHELAQLTGATHIFEKAMRQAALTEKRGLQGADEETYLRYVIGRIKNPEFQKKVHKNINLLEELCAQGWEKEDDGYFKSFRSSGAAKFVRQLASDLEVGATGAKTDFTPPDIYPPSPDLQEGSKPSYALRLAFLPREFQSGRNR